MAKAVVARRQGDDYQARFFWIQACRLFEPVTQVIRVGYEVEGAKGFDDVVAFYDPPIQDEFGQPVVADYYQVKFHTTYAGAFTWEALMDPAWIGATSVSLLQRLAALQKTLAPDAAGRRFTVMAPWPVHPDNPLAHLVSGEGGQLRLDRLRQGGPRSVMGKVRGAWRAHLGERSDDQLFEVIRPLRIKPSRPDLDSLRRDLNGALRSVGLMPVPDDRTGNPYDDLIAKLRAQGCTSFSRDEIKTICLRERLWSGGPQPRDPAVQLGIRSFLRWTEYLEDKTDHMLCLVRHFDGRAIRSPKLWYTAVYRALARFFRENVTAPGIYNLYLETHASIAFAAGEILGSKSGAEVAVVQSTRAGKVVWHPARTEQRAAGPPWSFEEIGAGAQGTDIAVAVSISWDIGEEVREYVERALPTVGQILTAGVLPEPGSRAAIDGPHAMLMAETLVSDIRRARSRTGREGVTHLFIAGPNAFTFFLGQLAGGLGRCVLYEFGFDRGTERDYQPSLTFPVPVSRQEE